MRDVVMLVVVAALIMSPSFLASVLLNRLRLDFSIVALGALALFLVGVFLLLRVLKD